MFGHNIAYTPSVGQRSPFPCPPKAGECASLIAGAVVPLLVVRFAGLNATDLTLFSSGRIDVPRPILNAFAPLLAGLLDERRDRTLYKVREKHQAALTRYYRRWADPMRAMLAAPVMARAA